MNDQYKINTGKSNQQSYIFNYSCIHNYLNDLKEVIKSPYFSLKK